jgi:hypothetical protein
MSTILAVADLHGHLDLLIKALRRGREISGLEDLEVVLLGDYVDNGPDVPELLEFLSTESWKEYEEFKNMRVRMICGNHDLACILAVNPMHFNVDENYSYTTSNGKNQSGFQKWKRKQVPYGGTEVLETYKQYAGPDCTDLEQFKMSFLDNHREFLERLPWYVKIDQYLFVHAGVRDPAVEPLDEQLAYLDRRDLRDMPIFDAVSCPKGHQHGRGTNYGIPDQLTNNAWGRANHPQAGCVVVTGHHKYASARDFVASHRVGLHSCACEIQHDPAARLRCALLPRGPPGATTDDCPPVFFSVGYD